jgi:hypothetical protein
MQPQIPGMGNPTDAVHIEMQRMQLELQRRDALIEEQQKRIFQLEDEVKRYNKQVKQRKSVTYVGCRFKISLYNCRIIRTTSKPRLR